MISPPNNIIPVMLRDSLFDYWQSADRLPHYFWIHYVFEALYNLHDDFRAEWDARRIESSDLAHALQGQLPSPYDQAAMQRMLTTTHVQKLTYKIPPPGAGTFWHQLCSTDRQPTQGGSDSREIHAGGAR